MMLNDADQAAVDTVCAAANQCVAAWLPGAELHGIPLGSARIIQLRHTVHKKNASVPVSTPDQERAAEHDDRQA
jgi:hypothetical protein